VKTIISVDFDFFVRENPLWDWGHSENNPIFINVAWQARYGTEDLYKECDIKKYADFDPCLLITELIKLGFKFKSNFKLRIADSHRHCYEAIEEIGKSRVYNFDTHHDLWRENKKQIDCANWLWRAVEDGLVKYVHWIAPSWSEEFNNGDEHWFNDEPEYRKFINGHYFKTFKLDKKPVEVDALFICRSSCWVPPHLDPDFLGMIKWANHCTRDVKFMDNIYKRKYPTRKESEEAMSEIRKFIKKNVPSSSVLT
jgi:hypothetical protein